MFDTLAHAAAPARSTAAAPPREFLTFTLAGEEYGIDILKVQEIRGYDAVTRIPDAPPFVRGVINLRGTIVPVVDLRMKFRLGEARYDGFTAMIVVNASKRVVGVVVDGVCDVAPLAREDIHLAPEFGGAIDSRHLTGIGTRDGRMLILLDIEGLLGSTEFGLVAPPDAVASNSQESPECHATL
ncbi:MAG TPA: chemotaxis protein CheW [Tahibacter sp.]|nr:chemotaxis protein CheW [Tahibacter sp.]